jgi:DNA replication and repair protein RecF
MAFDLIRISDLRNLTDCEIVPHVGLNLVHGQNGSGKTSFLEAIYILGRGRSFRDKQLFNAVKRGKNSFTLFGKQGQNNENSTVGINYSKRGATVRIDGEKVTKLSVLAKKTPIHIITPRSLEIIENGSSIRRRFLDWGVFHVEPLYQHFSSRYQRALSQRNRALRENSRTAYLWNKELVESGSKIQGYREIYFDKLKSIFFQQLEKLGVSLDLEVVFYRGWARDRSLQELLENSFATDEKRKFTGMGPHRADIIFKLDSKSFDKWGSRGQLKLVVFALFFAQAEVIKLLSQKAPILLVDDITAELDKQNIDRVLEQLVSQRNQIFVATTDQQLRIIGDVGKMFHVEHGVVSEQGV